MTKSQNRKTLESMKQKLKKSAKRYHGLGDEFNDSDNRILGPENDIEFQKIKKDIKESDGE